MEKKYEYGRHLLLEAYKSFIEKYDLPRNLNVARWRF